LGPLGTAATNSPIVPAPVDYDDGEIGGMMIGRGNLPQCRFVHRKPPDANQVRHDGKPATNRLSYNTAFRQRLNCGIISCMYVGRCTYGESGNILGDGQFFILTSQTWMQKDAQGL
jgi:hypothetical protein